MVADVTLGSRLHILLRRCNTLHIYVLRLASTNTVRISHACLINKLFSLHQAVEVAGLVTCLPPVNLVGSNVVVLTRSPNHFQKNCF